MAEGFITVSEAFDVALERIKGRKIGDIEIPASKVYVWRQRFNDGKLSYKKIEQILEVAGFKKVVEEQWISIAVPEENKISIDIDD